MNPPKPPKKVSKKINKRRDQEKPGALVALEKRGLWVGAGALAILLLLFFNPIFFGGKTFESSDHIIYMAHGPYLEEAFSADGELPFWNSYVLCGMPAYASMLVAPYTNPVTMLLGAVPEIFRIIFFYLLIGVFLWLFFRRQGVGVFAAVIGAATFVFSTQIITLVMAGHHLKVTTLVFLPLVLLATDGVWKRPSLGWVSLLAFAVGTMLITGHFQIAFYALLASGILLVVSTIYSLRDGMKVSGALVRWGLWMGGLIVGLAASAVLTMMVQEYSASSIRGGGGDFYDYASQWSLHPLEVPTFIVASFFGFGHDTYWGWMPFTDAPYYLGVLPLFLAALTVVMWPKERFHVFLISVFGVSLLLAFGKFFPVLYKPFFKLVPFFDKFRIPSMIMVLVELSVAGLAAVAVHRLTQLANDRERALLWRRFRVTAGVFAGIVLVLGALVMAGVLETPSSERFVDRQIEQFAVANPGATPPARQSLAVSAYEQTTAAMSLAKTDVGLAILFLAGALVIVALRLRGALSADKFIVGVLALVIIDLWIVDSRPANYVARTNPPVSFQATPAVQYLAGQPRPFRVFPMTYRGVVENWLAYFKIESVMGSHPAKLKLLQDMIDDEGPVGIRNTVTAGNLNLLNILNARYVLSDQPLDWGPDVEVVHQSNEIVMRNNAALPRMWFVSRARVIADADAHLAEIANPAWQPRDEALVFEDIGPLDDPAGGSIRMLAYKPREIGAAIESPGNCLVVLSEIYYQPGWNAWLDDTPVPIHRVNYALRGVVVPAGSHQLKMRFDPPAFRPGARISSAAYGLIALGLIGSLGSSMLRRRRSKPASIQ